jgi:serine phosphatase RsbU (regulator of sigma subunit)
MTTGSSRFISFCSGDARTLCDVFVRQHVYDIFEDSKGYIWFASSSGVHRYDPVERNILSISRIHYNAELLDLKDVYCVTEDYSGRIWIGTSVGLIKHIPQEERYEVFQAGMRNNTSNINSNSVFCLHVDRGGDLWVGTASGLNRYHPETNSFEFFRDPVELSESRIYGMLEDTAGFLWLSSDHGLSRYDPKLQSYIQFETIDGLQSYEFIQGSYFQTAQGRMYFGGNAGLNTFHPDSVPYNPYPPSLSFTQFIRFREQGGMSKPLSLDRATKMTMVRGVEIVTIHFSALEFTAPEKNRYLYKMVRKGQDGLWIHNREQNSVTFYRLSPGTYTLSVKGSNNDLLYSEEEISLEIIIPYPFWNKTLAILVYVLIGSLVVFLIIQIRTRSLRKSNRILRDKEISAMEISKQREELARKNKNITDSIVYAKRIQQALLPNDDIFKSLLPNSFVLFKPKDIVSGDFYWINQHGNKIYVAAVDCTGHGVPGAFVSIIGFELFRKITASAQGSNPAMILDTLNENFTDMFSDGEQVYLNDGMDLSLCIIDNKEKSIDYSGAFNPLYLVRNETIIEVKADRFSVGADVHFSGDRKLFKSHKIYLQKDDVIYMFSDGYADQFGGPEGKKFKYRRFRHLLLTIHNYPMEKQQVILDASIEEWMGNIDQVDDILVIGIKP